MTKSPDIALLQKFEEGLHPADPHTSEIPVTVLGYGEISTVFQINNDTAWAFKRMPLFDSRMDAEAYLDHYYAYCSLLEEAGLILPKSQAHIVELPGRPVVLYLIQETLPVEDFAHKLIHTFPAKTTGAMLDAIVFDLEKVWAFNQVRSPETEIAIDGQLSNWVWTVRDGARRLYYIDTSTPLYRLIGNEQLNPELFLKSAPSFLRWLIRWLFLDEVMERYYLPREVYTDLAGNCIKENAAGWISEIVDRANRHLETPLTVDGIEKYYSRDKIIWKLFLGLRKMDRWIQTKLLRRRYEFILPEIERR